MSTSLKYYDTTSGTWKSFTGYVPAPTNETIAKEAPAGTQDGANTTFTTSTSYVGGTLNVFVNGLNEGLMVTETDPAAGTFDLSTAPLADDDLQVSYMHSPTGTGNADTVDGYHANSTPTANTVPVLDANSRLPESASGKGVDANGWIWEDFGSVRRFEKIVGQSNVAYSSGDSDKTSLATTAEPTSLISGEYAYGNVMTTWNGWESTSWGNRAVGGIKVDGEGTGSISTALHVYSTSAGTISDLRFKYTIIADKV